MRQCIIFTPCGWWLLQVKTLRLLQYFPPPEDRVTYRALNDILKKIITGALAGEHVSTAVLGRGHSACDKHDRTGRAVEWQS